MYYFIGCILVIAVIFCLLFHHRKKIICKKLDCMSMDQKCDMLGPLIEPFGYCYIPSQDIFSTTVDAPQRLFGYTALFDRYAAHFNMAIDCMPVYFDYGERTWLIEFWKGQYGINAGAEIGIYHADGIVSEKEYKTTLFTAASDEELLRCSFTLCGKNGSCVQVSQTHWWLTAFFPGCFVWPSALDMKAAIRFTDRRMQCAFVNGLRNAGYAEQDFMVNGLCVTVNFTCTVKEHYKLCTRFWRRFSQWKNKIFCRLYLWVTRPFQCTEDRVLCLYYYLPVAFRKLLRLRRFHRRCHKNKRCCRKRCCKKGRL